MLGATLSVDVLTLRLLRRYKTPNADPTDFVCRVLRVPNDLNILAAVNEVLGALCNPDSWEDAGLSPEETCFLTTQMFFDFFEGTVCMIGAVIPFTTAQVPTNALLCDGATYLKADYPRLYDTLDPVFQTNPTQFRVPNLTSRFVTGLGVLDMDEQGGEATHVLTTAEMPIHTHTTQSHNHSESIAVPSLSLGGEIPVEVAQSSVGVTGGAVVVVNNAGAGAAHNTLPPFTALRYCVVAK